MPTKPMNISTISSVPIEYGGKWVIWTSDHSAIVASGESMEEMWSIARERNLKDPIFEKVPRSDVRFVGRR